MVAAFGTTDNRKLDNTSPGVIANPGPGAYKPEERTEVSEKKPLSVFKSNAARGANLAGDVKAPGPTSYNLADFNSISKKPLQGGAPNNVLSLQKAENKKFYDQMFPFLVKSRMEDDPRVIEVRNVGPGSYSPHDLLLPESSKQTLKLKNNLSSSSRQKESAYIDTQSNKIIDLSAAQKSTCFGSSQGRFDELENKLKKNFAYRKER